MGKRKVYPPSDCPNAGQMRVEIARLEVALVHQKRKAKLMRRLEKRLFARISVLRKQIKEFEDQ